MRDRKALVLWAAVVCAGGIGLAAALGRYGANVLAVGLLYAVLATSWSWIRATGLLSFGQAAFFGAGALTQAWLVTIGQISPWPALAASAASGALAALPLIPALRLSPANFALATLAWAGLLRGLAGNVPAFGMEGYLMPQRPGFDGASLTVIAALAALAVAVVLGYQAFLGRPGGRTAAAIRQSPETSLSLGFDLAAGRWRPLILGAAATGLAGALYSHLVGSVETSVVFSPLFSILPLVMGMLGGALHPLGAIVGTLALYPLDELLLRPLFPQAHGLAWGFALCALLLVRPSGLLKARVPEIPASPPRRHRPRGSFPLAVRNLAVRRDGVLVLTGINFTVEPGQILRVLGPNGAGKTSLLLAIAARLPAAGGEVLFGGVPPPRGAAARARSGLARTFQAPVPFPEWTVRENVALAAQGSGTFAEVDGLLEELDLTALGDRPAGRLSLGEGKRLELARALAAGPSLLLLDEPLAGLSPAAAGRVSGLIERARLRGAAIVWVEHGPAAGEPASQLLVLEDGRSRFLGSPAEWEAARRATAS